MFLSLWATTPLGVKQLFDRDYLRPLETQILTLWSITVAKLQLQRNSEIILRLGSPTGGAVWKDHSVSQVEDHRSSSGAGKTTSTGMNYAASMHLEHVSFIPTLKLCFRLTYFILRVWVFRKNAHLWCVHPGVTSKWSKVSAGKWPGLISPPPHLKFQNHETALSYTDTGLQRVKVARYKAVKRISHPIKQGWGAEEEKKNRCSLPWQEQLAAMVKQKDKRPISQLRHCTRMYYLIPKTN